MSKQTNRHLKKQKQPVINASMPVKNKSNSINNKMAENLTKSDTEIDEGQSDGSGGAFGGTEEVKE